MTFTPSQLRRLKKLLAFHRDPPTWRRLLPAAAGWVVLTLVLVLGYAAAAGGGAPAPVCYALGLVTFVPIKALSEIHHACRRWPVTDAVIDWPRVERLVAATQRPDAGPAGDGVTPG